MSLNAKLSFTPLEAEYSSAEAYGWMTLWGTWLYDIGRYTLKSKYENNMDILRYSPFPSPLPDPLPSNYYEYSIARVRFRSNATIDDQYLLLFHVSASMGTKAGFYINGNLVREEELNGDETVAILFDCPESDTYTNVYMALGSGYIELKGIDCYVV